MPKSVLLLAIAFGTFGCMSRGGEGGAAGMGGTGGVGGANGAEPFEVDDLVRHVPAHVPDRRGWAEDIALAIEGAGKAPTPERACAVIAVIEQESGFKNDPQVAGLPRIVRQGLRDKLEGGLGPLAGPALASLLAAEVPGSKDTFGERIDRLKSERDLDRLFRTMANGYRNKLPGTYVVAAALSRLVGKGSLEDLNPITTAGSMQVKISFARGLAEFSGFDDGQLREHLYTRAGGVRAGTAFLLGYAASYDDLVYRFADFNAGRYASRNAAFQSQVSDLTGRQLVLDGDLLSYDDRGEPLDAQTRSLDALLAFAAPRGMWESSVRRHARKEKSIEFEETELWEDVREAWKEAKGKEPPYAVVPTVAIVSPKMVSKRSTAWFAGNVKRRYEACRARGVRRPTS